MQIALAPMEGVVDADLRDLITRVGGVDWCVTEFIRVTTALLPARVFQRLAPELRRGARTPAGVPVRLQLLGSDPTCLAENASMAVSLGAPVIDLNFGCPAKTVNRSRGGAVLLDEPELLFRIAVAVRAAVPPTIPVTAKIRLGVERRDSGLDCARALASGGITELVVHARSKQDGYHPPAHWDWIARIRESVDIPVMANGEIWSVADWRACRRVCGAGDIMLGRGLIARPDLARQIAADAAGITVTELTWDDIRPMVDELWSRAQARLAPAYAPGRLKQWLSWLARAYPEAGALFSRVRTLRSCADIEVVLATPAAKMVAAA